MRRISAHFVGLAAVFFLVAGCDGKGEKNAPSESASIPEASPEKAPQKVAQKGTELPVEPAEVAVDAIAQAETVSKTAKPRRVELTVEGLNEGPEAPMGTVDIAFVLPAGWDEATAWGKGRFGPVGAEFAIGFQADCNGQCAPGAIAGNMSKAFEGLKESASRPNRNTGDPAKDALRADVETISDVELSQGRALALRVTYSKEILASGPYKPQVRMMCAWHRPGDDWFLSLNMWAVLEEGEKAVPAILDICRSVEIVGPTPNEAQKKEPMALTGKRLELSLLPEGAYTVDSKNSKGVPSVILLNQPVVFGDLTIAPIGRIYVEYNDDPITLRDIYTTSDQSFQVGEAKVTCLHRAQLRVDGDGNVRRCILSENTTLGSFSLTAFTEASFEGGQLRRGTLLEEATFPEGSCQAGTIVEFDVANGGLTRCSLSKPLEKKGISIPAGAVVKFEEAALLDEVKLPKDAVMKVGEESFTGPGSSDFRKGAFHTWSPSN